MRVALVVDHFDPLFGGLEAWTVEFAAHLLDSGHAVLVVAFGEANHRLPVQSHILPHASSPLERARRVAASIAALRPDVVHDSGTGWSGDVFHPQTGSQLLSHARLLATYPRLLRLRTAVSPRGWLHRSRMARLEQLQAVRAKRIVAVSHRLRALLAERHGVQPSRISVIPNGVDTRRFAPARLAGLREPARHALRLGDDVLFLAVAYNMRLKGIDTAMRALAMLVQEGAAARLAVAGGEANAFWTRLASRLGVHERVQFLGRTTDIAPLYAAADAVVHPTRWDACSLATIEGLAAGLPVITTAMNGAGELIADGHSGFVLPDPEDAAALAAHMRLLLDPAARRSIGMAARDAVSGHDARDNFRAVEAVLQEVAEECRQ